MSSDDSNLNNITLNYYNENASSFIEGTQNTSMFEILEEFIQYIQSKGRVLDLGCGSGRDSKYLLEHGFLVDAMDGSKELCQEATHFTGIQVKQMDFLDINELQTYDGIWACASILHLPYHNLRINENWINYLQKNEAILRGWIQNELIQYLQRRNPNVPGIPFKIHPPEKRDLKAAMNFWSAVIEHHEMNDIYTGKLLNRENFDELGRIHIDHFVPWSYLASDEVWNLTPTFAKINISKSNQVPNQKKDIELLSKQHYMALQIAQSNKEIKRLFETYTRKNLNSTDIKSRLYSGEISEDIFTKNMVTLIEPICHSAKNLGFMEWNNRGFITSVL
jgi:SAM-dependent methyltransferase